MALLSSEISTKSLVPVCRQIATAYEAGIPITRVMDTVGSQQRDPKIRRVFSNITADLMAGDSLGEATKKQSKYLSPYLVTLLASGEKTGKLDVMLNDLSDYYEDKLAMRRMIIGALTYPLILICMCWYIGSFALGILRVALSGMDGSGRGLQDVTAYFSTYFTFQLNAHIVFGFIALFCIFLSRMGLLKWVTGLVTTFIWPLSIVTRKLAMARFFRSFGLMLSSGLNTVFCIEKSAEVTGNPYIMNDLMGAIPMVQRGHTLVESFAHSRMMTPLAREMLAVGEQSGNLDGQLQKAATYHLNEANQAIKVATTVLTTMIMLLAFSLAGGLVIYFYTSLYGGLMDGLGI